MPITIKSTELKYKNPSTGQYQGVDAVAEMTTSEQCALIEAKGAEVIESIPSDYTTLSGTVSDLTSDVSDLTSDVSDLTSDVSDLNGAITNEIIRCDTAIAIPSSGNNVIKTLAGLTSAHELIRWNFSSSAENSPPCDLTWGTYDNSTFVIVNNSGTTSETIKPVFVRATAKTAT